MDEFFKRPLKFATVVGFFLIVLWVGWWYLRWSTGMAVFDAARDHLRNSLGLSTAVATVVATATGIASAFVMTVLVVNANYILASVAVGVLGLPLALLNDALSADQCFNRQTGKPLCHVYETPEGSYIVRRKDDAYPPSSWILQRDATREDARAYLPLAGETGSVNTVARVPHPINLESCSPATAFFDAAGTAIVYWSREDDGIRLYNRSGPNPTTGKLLQPMTSQMAKEVCAKLAAVKRERETKLARDQAVQAESEAKMVLDKAIQSERETNEQVALRQARRELQEAQAQQALDAQRQQQTNQPLSRNIVQHEKPSSVTVATLRINNNDCRGAFVYVDGQMIANVSPGTNQALSLSNGEHMLRICEAGTAECGPEVSIDIVGDRLINYMSSKPGCGRDFSSRLAPQWTNSRIFEERVRVGNRSRYAHRPDAFSLGMNR